MNWSFMHDRLALEKKRTRVERRLFQGSLRFSEAYAWGRSRWSSSKRTFRRPEVGPENGPQPSTETV
jgi:hypothetical protein